MVVELSFPIWIKMPERSIHKRVKFFGATIAGMVLLTACGDGHGDVPLAGDSIPNPGETVGGQTPQGTATPLLAQESVPPQPTMKPEIPSAVVIVPTPVGMPVTIPSNAGRSTGQQKSEVTLQPQANISRPELQKPHDVTTTIPFLWTKSEILFGPEAGFEKARRGQSITVWIDMAISSLKVADIIEPWNHLAGWSLFVPASGPNADVNFAPSNRTWVRPNPSEGVNYTDCTVYWNATEPILNSFNATQVAQHEIGHCLGFVDFVGGAVNTFDYVNPQRCDAPSPKFYFGIMGLGYCYGPEYAFSSHDRKLLELAGYIR